MKWLRHIVINYLTRNLLKAVTDDEILLVSGKDWFLNKRKLTVEEILLLKEEAQSLKDSSLLKVLKKELKYGMTQQRYDKAKTIDDMIFGKAQAYCISQIEVFIDRISKL